MHVKQQPQLQGTTALQRMKIDCACRWSAQHSKLLPHTVLAHIFASSWSCYRSWPAQHLCAFQDTRSIPELHGERFDNIGQQQSELLYGLASPVIIYKSIRLEQY